MEPIAAGLEWGRHWTSLRFSRFLHRETRTTHTNQKKMFAEKEQARDSRQFPSIPRELRLERRDKNASGGNMNKAEAEQRRGTWNNVGPHRSKSVTSVLSSSGSDLWVKYQQTTLSSVRRATLSSFKEPSWRILFASRRCKPRWWNDDSTTVGYMPQRHCLPVRWSSGDGTQPFFQHRGKIKKTSLQTRVQL